MLKMGKDFFIIYILISCVYVRAINLKSNLHQIVAYCLQLSVNERKKNIVKEFRSFFSIFHSIGIVVMSPITSTNKKRKADELESNQPDGLRPAKVRKIESMQRKYQNSKYYFQNDFILDQRILFD